MVASAKLFSLVGAQQALVDKLVSVWRSGDGRKRRSAGAAYRELVRVLEHRGWPRAQAESAAQDAWEVAALELAAE